MAERTLQFSDANLLRELFGAEDANLHLLERRLKIEIAARGTQITLRGEPHAIDTAAQVLEKTYAALGKENLRDADTIPQLLTMLAQQPQTDIAPLMNDCITVPGRRRSIAPRTPGQKQYLDAIRVSDLVFGIGPAGTGKTYLAMAMAVDHLLRRKVERIVLCRPAVEAGEKLGFLPGSMQEKVNPYLRPLYDALRDMIDSEPAQRLLDDGTIEVAPLAFMRGRTLAHAFVILDEAQNCTPEQMKMFLTRLGVYSKAVVTGDVTQIDLPSHATSGLVHALHVLKNVRHIGTHYLSEEDVVRHPLVQSIIRAYEENAG